MICRKCEKYSPDKSKMCSYCGALTDEHTLKRQAVINYVVKNYLNIKNAAVIAGIVIAVVVAALCICYFI